MIKTRLIKLLVGAKKYVVWQVVCQWVQLVARIVVISCSARILSDVALLALQAGGAADGGLDARHVGMYAALIVAGILAGCVLDRVIASLSYHASVDVKRILRERIYAKLLRLGSAYRERTGTAAAVQLMSEGVEQLETYFGKYLAQFFYSLLAPLTLFIYLFPINHKASVVLLLCVPLIPLSIVVVQKIAKRLLRRYWGRYARLGDSFLDNLQGMTALKTYQADGARAEAMDAESEHFRRVTMKVLTMQLNSTSVMDIVAYGGAAVGMAVALSEYVKGGVTLYGALCIILLSAEFFLPLRRLGSYFHVAMNGMAASDRMFALLDAEEGTAGTAAFPRKYQRIVLEGVSYTYEGASRDAGSEGRPEAGQDAEGAGGREVLHQLSMTLPRGQFIALVGVSGSGKSTIAGLLHGRNVGYAGHIRVEGAQEGAELSDIDGGALADHITHVSADTVIFKGTVRENLLMGKPNASEKELALALHVTGLEEELGLDAALSEGGRNLSGGQRQRLAMARAILHNTPVYIFDEATSNIDVESEARIMALIHEIAKKKTVLMISHRLSHAAASDHIYYIEDGRILEEGRFEELLAADGAFARLYREQRALEAYAWSEDAEGEETPLADVGMSEADGAGRVEDAEDEEAPLADVGMSEAGGVEAGASEGAGHAEDAAGAAGQRPPTPIADPTARERARGRRRSGVAIMGRLIGLMRPLWPVMALAVLLGVLGAAAAISLTILATQRLQHMVAYVEVGRYIQAILPDVPRGAAEALAVYLPIGFVILLVGTAILRGILHYGEQYCNHFIAFRLLALVRHKVFAALCRLCPSKLEGRDRGSLIALITADIELLEVFYAHTISPVMIAILVSIGMLVFIGRLYLPVAAVALVGYVLVGIVLPLLGSRRGARAGMRYREALAALDARVLEDLKGIDEIAQYGCGASVIDDISRRSAQIAQLQRGLAKNEGIQTAATDLVIQLCSLAAILLYALRGATAEGVVACVALMGSFGPVAALSALSNHLTQTFAAGERVLSLLEEEPLAPEVAGRSKVRFSYGVEARGVSFTYPAEPEAVQVFADFHAWLPQGGIIGIHGDSGTGKSTLLKLIMRFWDVDQGAMRIAGADVREINTKDLRGMQAYMTQEAVIFHDTIAENIRIGRLDATRAQIEEAARKASIHDFITSLPDGYDTVIGSEGNALSGGERQRIGLARAFLHDADILLLDEPTSNLDALNEGIILKSLKETCADRTVVLVSHRKSTLRVADRVIEMGA